jgi:hypothetical protein
MPDHHGARMPDDVLKLEERELRMLRANERVLYYCAGVTDSARVRSARRAIWKAGNWDEPAADPIYDDDPWNKFVENQ